MYPVQQRCEAHLRIGMLILLLLAAALAAPVLDEIIGFFSDAPYVQYLPGAMERAGAAADAIGKAVAVLRFTDGI
jgi:hypothetical protein